jgi:hypothetical protein
MTFWDFASQHPFTAGLMVLLMIGSVGQISGRIMRMINIFKHGWPPSNCDADGDGVE